MHIRNDSRPWQQVREDVRQSAARLTLPLHVWECLLQIQQPQLFKAGVDSANEAGSKAITAGQAASGQVEQIADMSEPRSKKMHTRVCPQLLSRVLHFDKLAFVADR